VHPTLGILARFQAFFYASAFFQSDGVPPPAPARVTQTVRRIRAKCCRLFVSVFLFVNQIGFCKSFTSFIVVVSGFSAFIFNRLLVSVSICGL
jgi:hypothetical protein